MTPKNTICLWFDKDAERGALLCRHVSGQRSDRGSQGTQRLPGGKEGDVLTVEFTVLGIPCLGLNGGPASRTAKRSRSRSRPTAQEETDRYWNAIVGNGGQESECGWCKDRWGLSWQITPRTLTEAMAAGGEEARRAFEAMMEMGKIDVAAIDAARRG